MSILTKRARQAKMMLGEASSNLFIPMNGQCYNTQVYKIKTKHAMWFKSYEHFHQKSSNGQNGPR